jgi:zinc transporter ZupT
MSGAPDNQYAWSLGTEIPLTSENFEFKLATGFSLVFLVALGAISAISLPLGSLIGIKTNPRPALVSIMAAFGAGALIAALAVELVAPTVFALDGHSGDSHHGDPLANFAALVGGAIVGGLLFTALDRLVNDRGGFLRRTSSTISYLTRRQQKKDLAVVDDLAGFSLLKDLPPEHINALIRMIKPVRYLRGEVLAKEGEPGKEMGSTRARRSPFGSASSSMASPRVSSSAPVC